MPLIESVGGLTVSVPSIPLVLICKVRELLAELNIAPDTLPVEIVYGMHAPLADNSPGLHPEPTCAIPPVS